MRRLSVSAFGCALCACAFSLQAATSTAWELNGFTDLLKGHITGLSLSSEGILRLGPSVRWKTELDQPALWSLAVGPDRTIYAATGHQGKIFRLRPDGKASVLWTAEQSEVFALCVTPKGILYAGTSPNGALYRIENGKAEQIWRSPVKYIWSVQPAPDGALYVATGEQGRVYRVSPDGKADVYYETGQANVTSLAVAANGHLYAGTEPNGLLFDISSEKQGQILFDSTLPEIRSIVVGTDGIVYAAAMGGAVSTRSGASTSSSTSAANAPVVATSPTVITVTEAQKNSAATETDPSAIKPPVNTSGAATAVSSTPSNTTVTEVAGVEKSAIYRISPDRTVETLRSSKEDNVFDLRLQGSALIFSTDDRGRIYRLEGNKTTLLAEAGSGETTRLLEANDIVYAALSNPARVIALGAAGSGSGSYESPVHDSTSVARWGRLQWRGSGSDIIVRTRTGNSSRPDTTWSDWSAPSSDPAGVLIKSPSARFIQWRAEWPAGSAASLQSVSVPYLPQNAPPQIRSVTVSAIIGTNQAKSSANVTSSTPAYSITVTDTGQPPAATAMSSNAQTVSRLQTTQTQISWQADDPDGDKLVYSVYFRAEEQKEWQLIRSRMFENTLLLDPDVFADGRYLFRVVASDAPSNAAQYARETEMISAPVLVDNTPPLLVLGQPRRNGDSLDVDLDATDQASALRLCEYSMDAGFWQPIEATDGVTDSPHEQFHLHLDKLRPGEHLIVFRVYDAANNAGLARLVLH